jgi:hypothetical protein
VDAPVTPQVAKLEWQPPKLTALGDAVTLTAAQSGAISDGASASSAIIS